jgi:hypothetical protein
LRIIHKDCDKSLAKDRSLPRNSYIVTYIQSDTKKYDIVQASSFVEVFDNYYDTFGKDSIQKIKWTDGAVNPKTYQYNSKSKKK